VFQVPGSMVWGAAPELVGPRHYYRVGLMARALWARLPAGGAPHVLDAGAGRGTLAARLAALGYRVTALDESAAFVAYARQRWGGRHLRLVRGDVVRLPFTPAAFDAAVCGEVLEHVADDAAAVAELARVLRPGGVLVATVPAGARAYSWLDRWAGHARRYEPAALAARLAAGGFTVERLVRWGFPFGLLYERWVQRPVLRRYAHGAAVGTARRLGRSPATRRLLAALFRLDERFVSVPWGPGLLVIAVRR
jgi:SAM-dependent methyltransferase